MTRPGPGRDMASVFAVILAGGSGTRLWPAVRGRVPKQFLSLYGHDSLLQQTARRLRRLLPWRRITVVTTSRYRAHVVRQLPHLPAANLFVEPQARGTAASLIFAAACISQRNRNALLLAVPSDHQIRDDVDTGFEDAVRAATEAARRGRAVVTIGIDPTRVDPGFGYLHTGPPHRSHPGRARVVRRFIEKPSVTAARRYVRSGEYLWNSGLMAVEVASLFEIGQRFLLHTVIDICAAVGSGSAAALRRSYRELAAMSIDHAILEHLSRSPETRARHLVVRGNFEWHDLGSWDAVASAWPKDARGNAPVVQRFHAVDAGGCVVYAPGQVVAAIGVHDLIIVSVGGSILVCPRDRAQDVRLAYEALASQGIPRRTPLP